MKLYCDAAFWVTNKQAKLGIVVKNNKKRIYETTIIINDIKDSVEAEFHAIYKGILALKELGISKANILSDGKSNIAMIEIEKLFNNEEARKAYYHILKFMEICEEK